MTSDPRPTLAGTGQPGARIAVWVDATSGRRRGGRRGRQLGRCPPRAAGGWKPGGARAVLQDGAADPVAVAYGFHVDTRSEVRVLAPAADAVVGSPVPFLVGSSELGAIVDLTIDDRAQPGVDVSIDGSWVAQVAVALSPGAHTVRARATDRLGNVAEVETRFRYDPAQPDSDGDGRLDRDECIGGTCLDADGDGVPDFQDPDDDGDGMPSALECASLPCIDSDGDGAPDVLDPDDDADGIPTRNEHAYGVPRDVDRDGLPDHRDPDDDGDSVPTREECAATPCPDSDGDGTPDHLAPDDDGDGLPTARERADSTALGDD